MNKLDILGHIRQYSRFLTIQNAGLFIAVVVAFSWVWGSVDTLQRNYAYQRQVDANNQRIELAKIQNKTYEYQQAYHKSDEYLELSARAYLGKALPGEHLAILPSSNRVKDSVTPVASVVPVEQESNFVRWMNFFFNTR